jgi:Tol biopolymer transport system component
MNSFALPVLALVLTQGANAQPAAAVFAPGIVSTSAHEGPFALAPDGKTVYFIRFAAGMLSPAFFVSHERGGRWNEPGQIALPEGAGTAPFSLSPDGAKLYYTHTPDSRNRSRLWVADRDGDSWKNARPL